MNIKRDYVLKDWQRASPFVWLEKPAGVRAFSPLLALELLAAKFGPDQGHRLQTWQRNEVDPDGPHLIGVRGGGPMHTDPRYPRYTHQLVLYNDGIGVWGWSKEVGVALTPGHVFCVDTHSPHQVIPDARAGRGKHYLAASLDRKEPAPLAEVLPLLAAFAQSLRSN
jgi:hypothetical protein